MLRRSNSATHIPVPSANLFNVGKRRSRSMTRNSGSSATKSTLKPRKRSSSDSKLSINVLPKNTPYQQLKITPLNQQKSKTPCSSQPSTSSSKMSSASNLRVKKSIQKLSSDKKWVWEQHAKLVNFIESSSLFDPEIVTAQELKPLTIKSFVHISSVLLGQIFSTISITPENYKEVIPAKLKVLRYPGTLTNSVLKTVYTTQSWPQIMGCFGWLVDKADLKNKYDDFSSTTLDPSIQQNYLVTEKCRDFILQHYNLYNSNGDTENEQILNDQYVNDLKEILGVDTTQNAILEEDIHKKTEYVVKQKKKNSDLEAQIKEMQNQIATMKQEIDEYEEADGVQELVLDAELKNLQERLKKVRDMKNSLKDSVKRKQQAAKNQPCTYQEKLKLMRKIKDLKHEVNLKKEKIEESQKLRAEYDEKVNTNRSKLEEACISWNRSLHKWIIIKPKFKSLLLRETGFHEQSFLVEIKEVIKQMHLLDQELLKETEIVQNKIIIKQKRKKEFELQIETLNKVIESLVEECTKMEAQNMATEANIKSIKADFQVLKHATDQKIQAQRQIYENLKLKSEEEKKATEKAKVELMEFTTKSTSFLIEFGEKIKKCAKESEELVKKVKEQVQEQTIKKQNEILDALEHC